MITSLFVWLTGFNFEIRWQVLVHCTEGRSRSVALVAAFLMQKEKISLGKAKNPWVLELISWDCTRNNGI
jgi:hypothetical protein